jgi:hypothetical protein
MISCRNDVHGPLHMQRAVVITWSCRGLSRRLSLFMEKCRSGLYRVTRSDGTQIGGTGPAGRNLPGDQRHSRSERGLATDGGRSRVADRHSPGEKSGDRDPMGDAGIIIYELEIVSVKPAP